MPTPTIALDRTADGDLTFRRVCASQQHVSPNPRPHRPDPPRAPEPFDTILERHGPALLRFCVALRYLADLSHGDIGVVMGTTAEAARRNVYEGLERLRRELAHA